MATTGYPVAQLANGTGCTAPTLRQVTKARWENTGVVCGLAVTGRTTLAYAVTAGVAVCSKGDSDGYTECYFAGGSTPAVAAANSTNPRIDSVWITSHDATQGDADNAVTLGVTQGTAAATPTAPTIPTYATLLAQMVMPAGATTTANATQAASVGYAIPYGASLGVLHSHLNTYDGTADSSSTWYTEDSGTLSLPTDRLLEFRYSRCMSAASESSILVELYLDGSPFVQDEMVANNHWETHVFDFIKEVPAGTHTFAVKNKHQSGDAIWYHYAAGSERGTSHASGMTFDVIDKGVVR
ncbi:MAG: hypothetical protein LKF44_08230 [Atopobiaceae bacterium]|jgi:hypothetical protein|nr:hypothetical protein [Atopobiaceae bacterium]